MCPMPDGLDAVGLAVVITAAVYVSVFVTLQCLAEAQARNL